MDRLIDALEHGAHVMILLNHVGRLQGGGKCVEGCVEKLQSVRCARELAPIFLERVRVDPGRVLANQEVERVAEGCEKPRDWRAFIQRRRQINVAVVVIGVVECADGLGEEKWRSPVFVARMHWVSWDSRRVLTDVNDAIIIIIIILIGEINEDRLLDGRSVIVIVIIVADVNNVVRRVGVAPTEVLIILKGIVVVVRRVNIHGIVSGTALRTTVRRVKRTRGLEGRIEPLIAPLWQGTVALTRRTCRTEQPSGRRS
jgi:hypothetical protein